MYFTEATTMMRWHLGNEHRNIFLNEDLPAKNRQKLTHFVAAPDKAKNFQLKKLIV